MQWHHFIPNKPATGAGTDFQDLDGAPTYKWLVPLTDCGVTATVDSTDATNVFTKYDLFLNSNRKVFKKKWAVGSSWMIDQRIRSFENQFKSC